MLKLHVTSLALSLAITAGTGCKKEAEQAPPAAADKAPTERGEPRKIDMSDNKEIEELGRQAIAAYRDKNPERLAEIGPPGAKDKTIFIEPRNPNWDTLFGDDTWNMKTVQAWDGTIKAIERGIDAAYVIYHEDDAHRYAVELHKFDERWGFYHLKKLPKSSGGGIRVNPTMQETQPKGAPSEEPPKGAEAE